MEDENHQELFLEYSFLGNTVEEYLIAVLILGAALVVLKLFRSFILKKLKLLAEKTPTEWDNILIEIIQGIRPPFYVFLSFFIAIQSLQLPDQIQQGINYILLVWVIYLLAVAVITFIDHLVKRKIESEEEGQTQSALYLLGRIAKGVVWIAALLFILSNVGVDISSFVATLGIVGVAVALAVQNILMDLFSAFSIYFDKPFKVGDFVKVGDQMGTVEYIGIKSTRLRSLSGEQLVISNRELTTAQVHNYKHLEEWRTLLHFDLDYQTTQHKLEKVPEIVQEVVESIENARFDRAHFQEFGEWGLRFEVVYYVLSSQYVDFMDVKQQVLLELKKRFKKEKLEFAFPTRVIYQK